MVQRLYPKSSYSPGRFSGGIEKTSRNLKICLSGRDSKVAPTEYKSRILSLSQFNINIFMYNNIFIYRIVMIMVLD